MSEVEAAPIQPPDVVQNISAPNDNKMQTRSTQTESGDKTAKKATPGFQLLDGTVSSLEKNFHEVVMGKMFKDLEARMQETSRHLDEITQTYEKERKKQEKERLTEHIPGPLKDQGSSLMDILRSVDQHIVYSNYEPDAEEGSLRRARLLQLNERSYVSVMAHAIAAWMGTFEKEHRERLATRFYADASMWIARIWRFPESFVYFHGELWEGLLCVCRMALREKFVKYATEGFQALYSRPPVIYLSAAAEPGLADYLQFQLGLPANCICVLPANESDRNSQTIDIASFEQLIHNDASVGKTPLLLLAFAGTRLTGATDSLTKLSELCKQNKIWLHIEGQKLAQIALLSVPSSVQGVKSKVDSMTLNLSPWLGIPAIPYATLLKTSGDQVEGGNGSYRLTCNPVPLATKLSILPLWISLQTMGHDGIVERIKSAGKLVNQMLKHLKQLPNIKIVKREVVRKDGTREVEGVRDLVGTILSSLLTHEVPSAVVLFRYTRNVEEKPQDAGRAVAPYAARTGATALKAPIQPEKQSEESSDSKEDEPYFDALNQWLCETLSEVYPQFGLQTIKTASENLCIRYCPIETIQMQEDKPKDMENFIKQMKKNLSILDSTVNERTTFREVVDVQDQLEMLDLNDWAGLGAVRYLPMGFGPEETDALNLELLERLRAADAAFSIGRDSYHRPCIRFGLITRDTDVEELVGMLLAAGKSCEQESKFLDSMTERVKAGIEKAQEGLKQEQERRLAEEGALRQVPILDSLINWWSPMSKETQPRGLALHLDSGEIISTEDTYKFRMQVLSQAKHELQNSFTTGADDFKKGSHKSLLKPRLSSSSSTPLDNESIGELAKDKEKRGDNHDHLLSSTLESEAHHERQLSTASRITLESNDEETHAQ